MIKRLLIIGGITGLGHIVTLLSLKFISKFVDESTIAKIGELDSLTLLIISIVAFGLQLSATRNIALTEDWKNELYETQSARITLGIVLLIFASTGYFSTRNYLFVISPIIALNADYALYGRGKPIVGSLIALMRVMIPSLSLVYASVFFKNYIIEIFVASFFITYLVTGILVSITLKTSYLISPSIKNLNKYISNFKIGIANFSLFFIGIGLINILSYFNDDSTIAVAYIALKFYMLFKGVRRIIVQAFFQELKESSVALKVDCFAIIAGIIFLNTLVFFPNAVIPLLFDQKYALYSYTFIILGFAGFISSYTTSSGTRLLMKKKDKDYSINLIVAAAVTIIFGILFSIFKENQPYYISLAILSGEITLSILNIRSLNEKAFLYERLKFFMPLLIMTLLFFALTYLFGQKLFSYIISLVLTSIVAIFFLRTKFKEVL